MDLLSGDNSISRRTALTRLGGSALGLALMNSSTFASKSKEESLRSRLPKFSERSRALLSQVLEDPAFSGRIPANAVEALAKSENAGVDEASVLKALDGRLAKFKMPKRVFIVDELPRNAMGKVQKNILRESYKGIYTK